MLGLMPDYRDVDAGLRINTLEARLAERDAALAARDAELTELRAGLAGAFHGGTSARARRLTRILAIGGVLTSAALGLALVATRRELSCERAYVHDTIDIARAHQLYVDRQLAETTEKLLACSRLSRDLTIP